MMSRKTWLKVKRGLIADPKHRERMGIRVWLYFHILDRCDWEQGKVIEWRDEAEAEAMSMPVPTVRLQRRQLAIDGYIKIEHRGDHLTITVTKWVNPREYSGKVYNPPPLAGVEKPESDENLSPSAEGGDSKSDSKSDSESDSKSDKNRAPLIRKSQNHIPQVTESGASSAPSRDQTLWVQVLTVLRQQMNRGDYDTWVRETEVYSQQSVNGSLLLQIAVPNAYAARHLIEMGLDERAAAIASKIAEKPVSVKIIVA